MAKTHFFKTFFIISFFGAITSLRCIYYEMDERLTWKGFCFNISSDVTLEPKLSNVMSLKELTIISYPFSTKYNFTPSGTKSLKSTIEKINPGVFDEYTNLKYLTLYNNKIKEIPGGIFNKLEHLEILDLSYNRLPNISTGLFENLKSLKDLHLSYNSISFIEDGAFSDLISLESLGLSHNRLNILQAGLFKNLTSLQNFAISKNPLNDWQDVGFGESLQSINAAYTDLKKFNLNLIPANLHSINLSGGILEEFDFGKIGPVTILKSKWRRTATIDLSNNRITTLVNFKMVNAKMINLERNYLTEITELPVSVTDLNFQYNNISRIAENLDTKGNRIQSLRLFSNKLEFATCLNLSRLQRLDLGKNHIKTIKNNTFSACPSLAKLNLSFNQIEAIESDAFKGLNSLKFLKISKNLLKNVNLGFFDGVPNLETLYINENQISFLDVEELLKKLPHLKELSLNDNLFTGEDLSGAQRLLEVRNVTILAENCFSNYTCEAPTRIKLL